jgi:hypothetical protein
LVNLINKAGTQTNVTGTDYLSPPFVQMCIITVVSLIKYSKIRKDDYPYCDEKAKEQLESILEKSQTYNLSKEIETLINDALRLF